jgi:cytochrome b subunit of formate dehydrogenase
MGEETSERRASGEVEIGVREPLKRELEGEIRRVVETDLREELNEELRERLVARVKAELAEDIRIRIARVKAELEAEILGRRMPPPPPRQFQRFSGNFRAQHMVLMVSCIILIITGLPLKFHEARVSQIFFDLIGGVQMSTLIHRVGAVGLIGVGVYHLLYLIASREGRRNFLALLPRTKDATDLVQMFRYFMGRTDQKPRFGRFSYVEKFDYWAVYWGMVIMIGSGLLLWFLETSLQFLPKFAADIAREAHSDEGLLATLAIIIWHFYNVHLNPEHFPMNRTFWSGMISEEEMRRHHPLEYEELMASRPARLPAVEGLSPAGQSAESPPLPSPSDRAQRALGEKTP